MTCTACSGPLSPFGHQGDYIYARCSDCGTLQLDPLPSAGELDRAYQHYAASDHFAGDAESAARTHRNHYLAVERTLRSLGVTDRVLDYGCGWGGLVEHLNARGIACRGVDVEPTMIAHATERGLPVSQGTIDSAIGAPFSAVTLVAVLEHLAEHHAWIDAAKRVLEPGGWIVSIHPTARGAAALAQLLRLGRASAPLPSFGQVFAPPWHTVVFSVEGTRRIFEAHGFEFVGVHYLKSSRDPWPVGVVQWILEKINWLGWQMAGARWPLQIAHLFVFRAPVHEARDHS